MTYGRINDHCTTFIRPIKHKGLVFTTKNVSWEALLLCSSSVGVTLNLGGQDDMGRHSQSGPFHQSLWSRSSDGVTPREAQSAGLSSDRTWFQYRIGRVLWISAMRLLTKTLHRVGCPLIHDKTIVESVHTYVAGLGKSMVFSTFWISLVSKTAPQSSKRGNETVRSGATFVFEANKLTCVWLTHT